MSNLAKLEFVALDISGKNYLSWELDAEIHLDAKGLGETIKEGNEETSQDKANAMIFLRHHLHESLKNEYLTVKDPQILWNSLKERYDHQKTVILPKGRFHWLSVRLQDFKFVSEYNSAMFRITSQLKLCGEKITDEEMLEKIYSTFHANNILLQTQYREKGFKKYFELISCLLLAEQNKELLLKIHESRPTGSTPFHEANVVTHNKKGPNYKDYSSSSGRGRGRGFGGFGRGRGRGCGIGGHGRDHGSHFKKHSYPNLKWERKVEDDKNETNICYRCGVKGLWSRLCRTPKHLVDLYQESLKKRKKIETNLIFEYDEGDFDHGNSTHLEVADFFTSPEGNN